MYTIFALPYVALLLPSPPLHFSQAHSQIEELRKVVLENRDLQSLYDRLVQVTHTDTHMHTHIQAHTQRDTH
jgi:hypothetical protein